jgi:hypothetical protein
MSSIKVEDYSSKSIVVYGETKIYKEKLKELGGKYNGNLSVGPGWVFSNKKKEEIIEWQKSLQSNVQQFQSLVVDIEKLKEENEKLKEENKKLLEENQDLIELLDNDK